MDIVQQYKGHFDKAIDHLNGEISSLRTGRATPAILDGVNVEAYDTMQDIKSLASISVADAKTINVQPWDKSILQNIETAIRNSDLGLSPVNDGEMIRLMLPDLTSERRTELVKVLSKKLEEARIAIRKMREDVRNQVDKAEKVKEIGEDDKYGLHDDLEKMVKEYNEKIRQIGDDKETEILKV
jgi:ribosome recycling factor